MRCSRPWGKPSAAMDANASTQLLSNANSPCAARPNPAATAALVSSVAPEPATCSPTAAACRRSLMRTISRSCPGRSVAVEARLDRRGRIDPRIVEDPELRVTRQQALVRAAGVADDSRGTAFENREFRVLAAHEA